MSREGWDLGKREKARMAGMRLGVDVGGNKGLWAVPRGSCR